MALPTNENGSFDDQINSITVFLPLTPFAEIKGGYEFSELGCFPALGGSPYPIDVDFNPLGGGLVSIEVKSHYELSSSGYIEWFGYQMLRDLASTGKGWLVVWGHLFEDAVFVDGECEFIRASSNSYMNYHLNFLWSIDDTGTLNDSEPATIVVPTSSTSFNNNEDYSFCRPADAAGAYTWTQAIGNYAHINRISVQKPPLIHYIPRASGVRIRGRRGERRIIFELQSVLRTAPDGSEHRRPDIEEAIYAQLYTLGVTEGDLVGQGNTFESCVFKGYELTSDDSFWTAYGTYTFEQSLYPSSQG